jgi:glycosyltransferase involved in cell wall biosynthesis
VPVVTTKHGGQAGYIMDGINGRIVEPLDAETLATALADVMSSHERAVALGRGRHQEDREYLHPSRTAEGFAEIYRTVARGGLASPN